MDKEESKEKFLLQLEAARDINLMAAAEACGLDFIGFIIPEAQTDPVFRSKIKNLLEKVKYRLISSLYDVARRGKPMRGAAPELSYAKAIMQFIDDDVLLGSRLKVVTNDKVDDEDLLKLVEKVQTNAATDTPK